MKTPHDDKLTRCPKLGDEVPFRYCLQEGGALPCAGIIACWQAVFDVEKTLRLFLGAREWADFTKATPKDKVVTLVELIEKVKKQI